MKIKLDENIPHHVAVLLRGLGHDVHATRDEGLSGSEDTKIWDSAQKESRLLVTQDLDFSDSRKFVPGSHAGILLVRLGAGDQQTIIERIYEVFQTNEHENWEGCFVVATDRKVRVLRPPRIKNS
jgi:predicted nuclease of predicted toxin-antitoxin system